MEPFELQTLLKDLLLQAGRPEIAMVRVVAGCTLKVSMGDGSDLYAMIPHIGRSGERAPSQPSWPRPSGGDAQQDRAPADRGKPGSMRASYFAGLTRDLLDRSGHPAIAATVSFAEAGATGQQWQPFGFRVDLADGRAVYLSAAKGSTANSIPDSELPEVFVAEESNAYVEMSGVRR